MDRGRIGAPPCLRFRAVYGACAQPDTVLKYLFEDFSKQDKYYGDLRSPFAANQRRLYRVGGGPNAPITMVDLTTMQQRFELVVQSMRSEMADSMTVVLNQLRETIQSMQLTVHYLSAPSHLFSSSRADAQGHPGSRAQQPHVHHLPIPACGVLFSLLLLAHAAAVFEHMHQTSAAPTTFRPAVAYPPPASLSIAGPSRTPVPTLAQYMDDFNAHQ
jgi:hypothetical protein